MLNCTSLATMTGIPTDVYLMASNHKPTQGQVSPPYATPSTNPPKKVSAPKNGILSYDWTPPFSSD